MAVPLALLRFGTRGCRRLPASAPVTRQPRARPGWPAGAGRVDAKDMHMSSFSMLEAAPVTTVAIDRLWCPVSPPSR